MGMLTIQFLGGETESEVSEVKPSSPSQDPLQPGCWGGLFFSSGKWTQDHACLPMGMDGETFCIMSQSSRETTNATPDGPTGKRVDSNALGRAECQGDRSLDNWERSRTLREGEVGGMG